MRVFKLGDLEIDPSRGEIRRAGAPLSAETKVSGLIFQLVEADGAVVSPGALHERLWPGLSVSRDALYRVVKEARALLGDDGARQSVIKTLPGRGLRWAAAVEIVEAPLTIAIPTLESIEEAYASGRLAEARAQAQRLASLLVDPSQAARRARALIRAADLVVHGQVDREWLTQSKEALAALPDAERRIRGALLARQAYQLYWSLAPDQARAALEAGRSIASSEGDDETLAWLSLIDHMLCEGANAFRRQRSLALAAVEHAKRASAPLLELWSREQVAHDAMEAGWIEAVEAEADAIEVLSEAHPLTWEGRVRTMLRLHYGDLPAAERALLSALETLANQGPHVFQYLGGPMLWLRYEQGRLAEALPMLRDFVQQVGDIAVWRASLARAEWDAGDRRAARAEYEGLAATSFRGVTGNVFGELAVAHLAELCIGLEDVERAAWFEEQLRPHSGRVIVAPRANFALGPADLFLGRLAALQGREEVGRALLGRALELSERTRSQPSAARCHAALAQLSSGDEAAAHAEAARAIRSRLGFVEARSGASMTRSTPD